MLNYCCQGLPLIANVCVFVWRHMQWGAIHHTTRCIIYVAYRLCRVCFIACAMHPSYTIWHGCIVSHVTHTIYLHDISCLYGDMKRTTQVECKIYLCCGVWYVSTRKRPAYFPWKRCCVSHLVCSLRDVCSRTHGLHYGGHRQELVGHTIQGDRSLMLPLQRSVPGVT